MARRKRAAVSVAKHLFMAFLLCSIAFSAFAATQASPKPLSERDVIKLLKGGVTAERIEEIVDDRGISFEMTPETENELRAALRETGASADASNTLISVLHQAGSKATAPTGGIPRKPQTAGTISKTQRTETPASAKSAEPNVSQMTLMEKLEYAKAQVQQEQFDRALEVYAIIAREAPEPILYQDDMAEAQRLKAAKEERERRQAALAAETDDARRNLEVYQALVLKFEAAKDFGKAVFYQRKVCLVVNSPEAAQKLTELQRKLAELQAGMFGKSAGCPEGYRRVITSYGSYCSK